MAAQAIGQAVMNDLQAQRESLLRSKNAVQETNSDLGAYRESCVCCRMMLTRRCRSEQQAAAKH